MKRKLLFTILIVIVMLMGSCGFNKEDVTAEGDSGIALKDTQEKKEKQYQLVEKVYDNRDDGYVNTYRYEYDEQGKLLNVWMNGFLYGENGLEKTSTVEEYVYETDGMLKAIIYYTNGAETSQETIKCDEKGNIIVREDEEGHVQNYHYDKNNRLVELAFESPDGNGITIKRRYDDNGNLIEESAPHYRIQYEYSQEGKVKSILEDYGPSYRVYGKTDPTYSGLMESIIWYNEQQIITSRTTSVYDDAGNLLEEMVYHVENDAEELATKTTYKYIEIEECVE